MHPLYNPVRLKIDLPTYGLSKGEVGSIVETTSRGFLVEFFNDDSISKAVIEIYTHPQFPVSFQTIVEPI